MPACSRRGVVLSLVLLGLALGFAASPARAEPTAGRVASPVDGIWSWTLPDTPNGLHPDQSWSGASAASDGTIYVAGMDHVSNAALYRLRPDSAAATRPATTLAYVGDARRASEAAGTWAPGDFVEKFHTRPVVVNDRAYVGTLNHSTLDAGYLSKPGLTWYRYTPSPAAFTDLSASDPGAALVPHEGLVSIAYDKTRGRIYGLLNPTGTLIWYDVATGRTHLAGRPAWGRPYVYPGRALWVSRTGRVYFSAGNYDRINGAPYDPAVFDHIHYYDPVSGFGQHTRWKIRETRAIDAAQCFPGARTCFLADNAGNVYKWTEYTSGPPTWRWLGRTPTKASGSVARSWVFHVAADRTTAYLINSSGQLAVFDLVAGRVRTRIELAALDPGLFRGQWLYGYDAWDRNGRFYFAAFSKTPSATTPLRLVAIDPVRLLRAVTP